MGKTLESLSIFVKYLSKEVEIKVAPDTNGSKFKKAITAELGLLRLGFTLKTSTEMTSALLLDTHEQPFFKKEGEVFVLNVHTLLDPVIAECFLSKAIDQEEDSFQGMSPKLLPDGETANVYVPKGNFNTSHIWDVDAPLENINHVDTANREAICCSSCNILIVLQSVEELLTTGQLALLITRILDDNVRNINVLDPKLMCYKQGQEALYPHTDVTFNDIDNRPLCTGQYVPCRRLLQQRGAAHWARMVQRGSMRPGPVAVNLLADIEAL
eukprot:m51a1_g5272 hypothetical protein (270) ;mRNA; r:147425-148756